MRALRFLVNWIVMLTLPLWCLPAMGWWFYKDLKYDKDLRDMLVGRRWFNE